MKQKLLNSDIFGFIRAGVDAHTMGISAISRLLKECGYRVHICDENLADAVSKISKLNNISLLKQWIIEHKISRLGFSYRLDPKDARNIFGKIFHLLHLENCFIENGGTLRSMFFSGLPEACMHISREYAGKVIVFEGGESPIESLTKMGVPFEKFPAKLSSSLEYDNFRYDFAKKIISEQKYLSETPPDRSGYNGFGTKKDSVVKRISHAKTKGQSPLFRAHVGPYNSNRIEALREFNEWIKCLSKSGFLDILSIGSSQLSQSHFEKDWKDMPNGGGVPINSRLDLIDIWEASRPMLVRTYAGTANIKRLAEIYEETINIAWHALSLWWFCELDGRGTNSLLDNLREHLETLRYIAKTGKPFEPNVPHHFAFRGADDFTYVLSGYIAAKTAKLNGIKNLILQTMLNTPKYTWGIQDIAKTRALLKMVKELEDGNFKVYLQPRAGLDYFAPDLEKSKVLLASATAMMDDIEPNNDSSPDIIHVVSYCEAVRLATPEIINESIKITMRSLKDYRLMKRKEGFDFNLLCPDLNERIENLTHEVRSLIKIIETAYPNPYSAQWLYRIFKDGLLPVPYLWMCKDKYKKATECKTDLLNGGIKLVDEEGKEISPVARAKKIISSGCLTE